MPLGIDDSLAGPEAADAPPLPAARPPLRREIAILFFVALLLQFALPFLFSDSSRPPFVLGLSMVPSLLVGVLGGWLITPRSRSAFDRYVLPGLVAFAAFASAFAFMLLMLVGLASSADMDWSTLPLGLVAVTLLMAVALYAALNQLAAACGALIGRLAWNAAHRGGHAAG